MLDTCCLVSYRHTRLLIDVRTHSCSRQHEVLPSFVVRVPHDPQHWQAAAADLPGPTAAVGLSTTSTVAVLENGAVYVCGGLCVCPALTIARVPVFRCVCGALPW